MVSNIAKDMTIRIVSHTLMLLLLFVLQSMVFSRLRIMSVAPLIMPMAVIGVGLFEGATWGGGFGIAAGVLCDLSYSETSVFFTVLLTILGMAVGLLSEYVLTKGLFSYLLCCLLSLVIIAFLQMFGFLVFQRVDIQSLLQVGIIQTLYSLIFSVPTYYLTKIVSRKVQ